MKKINLTQGKVALVDDEDYEMLNQFKWYAVKCGNNFYAVTNIKNTLNTKGYYRQLRMHALIMNTPKGYCIDHKNMQGLDNRKENLRVCTNQQNQMNAPLSKRNKTGFKGVSLCDKTKTYMASIRINKIQTYLGMFKCKIEAARAYNEAALKYFGEFAYLNKISYNPNDDLPF